MINELSKRAVNHDKSKLESPEKEIFEEYTPKLKGTTYGSEEYKEFLKEMKPALDHHYANNRHHPEHFKNGVNDMNLFDLLEMAADWLAAGKGMPMEVYNVQWKLIQKDSCFPNN
jgi:hypothetical protein